MRGICKLKNDESTKVQNLEEEVSNLYTRVTYLEGKIKKLEFSKLERQSNVNQMSLYSSVSS